MDKVEKKFDLIVTVVNKGFSDYVVDVAKQAGASGATILYGRGTGIHEQDVFMGVNIQPEKELVLILAFKENREKIMTEIASLARLNESGKGLCFSMPVSDVAGINYLIKKDKLIRKKNKQTKKDDE